MVDTYYSVNQLSNLAMLQRVSAVYKVWQYWVVFACLCGGSLRQLYNFVSWGPGDDSKSWTGK